MSAVIDALTALAQKLGSDDLALLQPIADGYLSNVAQNSSVSNDVTQTAAFEAQVVAALPNLEQTDVKDAAVALKSLLDMEAASAQASLTPTPASTATPAATPTAAG